MVQGIGVRVYNNLLNYFNKKLNKSYKTLFKMLQNNQGLGFRVYNTLENAFNKHLNESYETLFKML